MSYEFEYLMHLFTCGSKGLTPHPPRQPVDFDRLIQLAQEQSVLPLVGAALSKASDIGFLSEKVTALVNITRKQALSNYIKRRQIFILLQDFEKAGIQAVLLKGYAVADMYAEPDCRISADTDIYVSMKDEKRAYKMLIEHGCKVNPRSPLSHHAVCEHPKMGHIELHVILYDDFVENIWFGKTDDQKLLQEAYVNNVFAEGSYITLGTTDNLIFLTLHMIKHFINCGISLRQMMDIALHLKTYRSQINFERFWDILETLKYKKLVNTVLSVMVLNCGFLTEDFVGFEKQDGLAIFALLEDIENGGWLGKNDIKKRKDAGYRYNRSRYTENKSTFFYWCYMLKRIFIRCFHGAIPRMTMLESKYPYAQKMRCLMPVAWVQHMISRVLRLLLGKFDSGIVPSKEHISDNEKSRIQLFKLMQIM